MVSLSFEQAVKNAIEAELCAEKFYRLLAESTEEKDARAFLLQIASQEAEHAERIRQVGEAFRTKSLPHHTDDNMEIIETAPEWAFVDGISYREALNLALENEEHAALFYGALGDAAKGKTAEFFKGLCRTENLHAQDVRRKIELLDQ